MARLMSVAFTEQAVVERRKTVTRRKGWLHARPGDRVTLCRKVMGRKKDEPLVRLVDVELVDVRRERLDRMVRDLDYGRQEVALEVFPGLHPAEFLYRYFIHAQDMSVVDEVTRIEWRYLETPTYVQGDLLDLDTQETR
jgi:hypothetical protein